MSAYGVIAGTYVCVLILYAIILLLLSVASRSPKGPVMFNFIFQFLITHNSGPFFINVYK